MAADPIPTHLRRRIYRRDQFACRGCGALDDLAIDHVWPRCEGGPTVEWNLRLLCRPCNVAKARRNREFAAGRPVQAHGSRHGYRRSRCRCEDCVEWSKLDNRRRRPLAM